MLAPHGGVSSRLTWPPGSPPCRPERGFLAGSRSRTSAVARSPQRRELPGTLDQRQSAPPGSSAWRARPRGRYSVNHFRALLRASESSRASCEWVPFATPRFWNGVPVPSSRTHTGEPGRNVGQAWALWGWARTGGAPPTVRDLRMKWLPVSNGDANFNWLETGQADPLMISGPAPPPVRPRVRSGLRSP